MMEKVRLTDVQQIIHNHMQVIKPSLYIGPQEPLHKDKDRACTRKRRDVGHERRKTKAARQARKSQRGRR